MAKRAGTSIGGRTGHPQVPGSEVEALRSGARIPAGSYGPGSVPYTDRNRYLLDAVVERHGWSEDQVAEAVGVDVDRVRRWRSTGVPNGYVPALRTLADSDTTDVAQLLPEGSRRRLDPRAREPQEDWVTLRRAASRLGMSSPELGRMAETAGLTIRHRGVSPASYGPRWMGSSPGPLATLNRPTEGGHDGEKPRRPVCFHCQGSP
jgi:hypothetical protein